MSASSLALISGVDQPWQFFALFGIIGGLAGIGHPLIVATSILPKWFLRRRGRAMAVATAGPGIAALITPIAVALLDDHIGWRDTWLVFAAVTTLTVIPGLLIRRQPEDVSLTLDGAPPVTNREGPATRAEASFTAKQVFGMATGWLLLAAHSLAFVSLLTMSTLFVPLFVEQGFTKAEAASALIAYGIAAICARLGWGTLVDRVGVRRAAMLLAIYSAGAIGLLIPGVTSLPVVFILGALVGYAAGGIMVVNLLLWPTYFGRAHLGAINGIVSPVTSLASSSGPFIVALIFDASGSYTGGLALLVTCWVLALVPLYFAKSMPARLQV